MNQTEKLLGLITKLDVIDFIGLARVLKVQLVKEVNTEATEASERYAPRDFSEVLIALLQNFDQASRARKREIISLVKAAGKKEK